MVDDQQVVRIFIEAVAIALRGGGMAVGTAPISVVEHAVPERLNGVDLRGRLGDPDAEVAAAKLAKMFGTRSPASPQVVLALSSL